jgi:hypothetical protein
MPTLKGRSSCRTESDLIFDIIKTYLFQARINIPGSATLRRIAGHVVKFAFLFALGAGLRRHGGIQGITAFAAFPMSLGCCCHYGISFIVYYLIISQE